jgi:hypothetical protein
MNAGDRQIWCNAERCPSDAVKPEFDRSKNILQSFHFCNTRPVASRFDPLCTELASSIACSAAATDPTNKHHQTPTEPVGGHILSSSSRSIDFWPSFVPIGCLVERACGWWFTILRSCGCFSIAYVRARVAASRKPT